MYGCGRECKGRTEGESQSKRQIGLGDTAFLWLDFSFHHLDQCHSMIRENGKQSTSVSTQLHSDFQAIPLGL